MAIFDRMKDRMRNQRPVGAAQGMPQQAQPEMAQEQQQPSAGFQRWPQPDGRPAEGFGAQLPQMDGMRRVPGRIPMEPGMSEADAEQLGRPRTAEEADAFRMGQRMGAEGLMEMAGITPVRRQEMAAENRLMNAQRLNKATTTLLQYRSGKASVNRRVVRAQEWWKLNNWQEIRKERGVVGTTDKPSNTGWLWNCIVGKHADAIDSYPEPVILPRMEDDKDEAVKLSKIVPVVMELNGFEQTYNDAMWQKMQEGTGVYGIFWDNTKLNGLGDISIKKVNILNLYWEPGISDIQDSRNVFYVSFEDKEDLVARYPELDGKLNTTKIFIEKYQTDDNVDLSNKAAVIDWYYKKHEQGRTVLHYCKYVNETCLYSSEEAGLAEGYYADGNYPFVLDALYPVEGSPAGYGYIDIARDTQTDIDTLRQAMVKNAVMRATPRYFMRKDGSINEKEFEEWYKPIVHTGGSLGDDSLRPVEVASMGGDAHNMLASLIDEIKFITGNTDVNNGGVPSGVTAASAIAALKEDSGRSSKDSTKAAYRAYRLIVNLVIERIRQFYDIPRQFRILGQDGQEQFESYNNANLQVQPQPTLPGQPDAFRLPVFDIEVRAQRENAYTKMSQNELALQFWQSGLLNPQMTDQALITLDMMDFRGKEELRKKVQQQGTMAQVLQQIGQVALALAQQYQPQVVPQLAGILQNVAGDMGAQIAQAAQQPQQQAVAGQTAPDDNTAEPHDAKENALVRRAAERSANASRPD